MTMVGRGLGAGVSCRMNGAELAGSLLTALGKPDMEPHLWDADAYPHCPTLCLTCGVGGFSDSAS